MALSYPEGECFFVRDGLSAKFFPASNFSNPSFFYRKIIVEFASNEAVARNGNGSVDNISHPRSYYTRYGSKPGYGYFQMISFCWGTVNNGTRCSRHPCTAPHQSYHERWAGYAQKQTFFAIDMPKDPKTENWLWIDMVKPLRAIYFPVSIQASEDFQSLATYGQINFVHQPARGVWRPEYGRFDTHAFQGAKGAGIHPGYMIGFNVPELCTILAIPRQWRDASIWDEKLVAIREARSSGFSHLTIGGSAADNVAPWCDLPAIVNSSFAVDLQYVPVPPPPPKNGFLHNLVSGVISTALGMVPGIGPILAASFTIAWQGIIDPAGFKNYLESGGWIGDALGAAVGSAQSARKYIHKDWQGGGFPPAKRNAITAGDEAAGEEDLAADAEEVYSEAREKEVLARTPPNFLLLAALREALNARPGDGTDDAANGTSGGVTSTMATGSDVAASEPALLRALSTGAIGPNEAAGMQEVIDSVSPSMTEDSIRAANAVNAEQEQKAAQV